MSRHETRVAKAHMIEYNKLSKKPQRGAIVFSSNMNRAHWLDEASNQGYFVEDCGNFATLK